MCEMVRSLCAQGDTVTLICGTKVAEGQYHARLRLEVHVTVDISARYKSLNPALRGADMILLWLVLASSVAAAQRFSYERYKVYRVTPDEVQMDLLEDLSADPGFDFWNHPRQPGLPHDIMVAPDKQSNFQEIMDRSNVSYQILLENVESTIPKNSSLKISRRSPGSGNIFTSYLRHRQMRRHLSSLSQSHKKIVTVESLGRTFEGRNIDVVKISSGGRGRRPIVLVDAGIHAREWIAPAAALFAIHQLVTNFSNRDLLEAADWHIIPLLNPDGYEYSHTKDRFWRKTRSNNGNTSCIGVDANRNFDFHWNEIGSSNKACRLDYAGKCAFSEKESQALRDHVLAHKDRIAIYVSLHSYGQYLMYPWGYTSKLPQDVAILKSLARAANIAQKKAGGPPYVVGSVTRVLYPAAGGSDDWVKGVAGVPLSYTVELPGGGQEGFDMPPSKILDAVTPFFEILRVFGKYVGHLSLQR